MAAILGASIHQGGRRTVFVAAVGEYGTPTWNGWLAGEEDWLITNYQLPNGPVKAGRRWGQRHPQGANLGSNGILNFLSKLKQWLPPAHPKSLG